MITQADVCLINGDFARSRKAVARCHLKKHCGFLKKTPANLSKALTRPVMLQSHDGEQSLLNGVHRCG